MITFEVRGPFEIKPHQGKGGRTITREQAAMFWQHNTELARERGVYVFAIRNRGVLPTYVGKATKGFGQETFAADKLANHYNVAMANCAKGTPVLFFVLHPRRRGMVNARVIDALETEVIELCARRNPGGLTNRRKRTEPDYSIAGVLRSARGKPSGAAVKFRSALGV